MTFDQALQRYDQVIEDGLAHTVEMLHEHGVGFDDIKRLMRPTIIAAAAQRVSVIAWMERGCNSLH